MPSEHTKAELAAIGHDPLLLILDELRAIRAALDLSARSGVPTAHIINACPCGAGSLVAYRRIESDRDEYVCSSSAACALSPLARDAALRALTGVLTSAEARAIEGAG